MKDKEIIFKENHLTFNVKKNGQIKNLMKFGHWNNKFWMRDKRMLFVFETKTQVWFEYQEGYFSITKNQLKTICNKFNKGETDGK